MPEVRGIMIDFFNERPYYYQAKGPAETRALHKIYELFSARAPKSAITSIAIAAGCNNGDAYHIHHGRTGVLLEALSEMLAVLLSNTDEPEVIECLFIDTTHESLLDKLRDKQKKSPLK